MTTISSSSSRSPLIVDCFLFNDEINLLFYRLEILCDVVDFFVIVESTRTFYGEKKRLYLNELYVATDERLIKYKEKIIRIVDDNFVCDEDNTKFITECDGLDIPNGYEIHQRNLIDDGIKHIRELCKTDLIIISNLNEIPNPDILQKIKKRELLIRKYCALEMDIYFNHFKNKYKEKHLEPKIITVEFYVNMLLNTPQQCRSARCSNIIEKSGWRLVNFDDTIFGENFVDEERWFSPTIKEKQFNIGNWEYIPINENTFLPPRFQQSSK